MVTDSTSARFDRSRAVTPIGEEHSAENEGLPETFPFGL
jgi:hypothetical protein